FFDGAENNDNGTTGLPPPISDRVERGRQPVFLPRATPLGKHHDALALGKVLLPISFAPAHCFRLQGDFHFASLQYSLLINTPRIILRLHEPQPLRLKREKPYSSSS